MDTRPKYLKTTSPQSLLAFNGERTDPMLYGYHLGNGYRLYSPVLRRFTSPDNMSPFGAGGINPYTYCEGDPINHTDPTGHFGITDSIIMLLTSFMSITPESSDTEAEAGEIMEGGEEQSARHRLNPTVDTNDNATVNSTDEPTPAKRTRLSPGTSASPQMTAGPSGLTRPPEAGLSLNNTPSPAHNPSLLQNVLNISRLGLSEEQKRSISSRLGSQSLTHFFVSEHMLDNFASRLVRLTNSFTEGNIPYNEARNTINALYRPTNPWMNASQRASYANIHTQALEVLDGTFQNQQIEQQLARMKQELLILQSRNKP